MPLDRFLIDNAMAVRVGCFLGVLVVMALLELLIPRREQKVGRLTRWPGNLGIVVVDTLLVRLLIPVSLVGFALWAEERGWGLLPLLGVPAIIAVPLTVLALDLLIYAQHVVFHHVPMLWRLHRMHHADLELDVTSGTRFHPIEILLSVLLKMATIALLGAPPVAVLGFEVLLNATAMFNHSNVRLPATFDRLLRLVLVTPDMHRVHHSVVMRETNSNYGFNLPWWDRLFGTYRSEPEAGQLGMAIGIERFRDPSELRLDRMLLQPWRE